MSADGFSNRVFDLRSRTRQIEIAGTLSFSNHIIQATSRAIWAHLYKSGFKVDGEFDTDVIEAVFVPFIRDATRSLVSFGYFAFVVVKKNPVLIDPTSYVVVPADVWKSCKEMGDDRKVVFVRQTDCDKYRHHEPELVVMHAPLENGRLTCPAMSVVDMHDAIIEFTRLSLLSDNINLRPKAWVSSKEVSRNPGVYHFLDENDREGGAKTIYG